MRSRWMKLNGAHVTLARSDVAGFRPDQLTCVCRTGPHPVLARPLLAFAAPG